MKQHKTIAVTDEDRSDLLSRFPECNAFIDQGREQTGVLVHWSVNPP